MKSQERAVMTRKQLIEAAAKCFAEQGYDGTGVAMICESAHVSKGAFYHHFDTKQAIFLALMQQWLEGLDHQLDAFQTSMQSVPEGLQSMTGLLGAVLEVGGDQLPMYLEFWSRATRDPQVWQETIAPFHRYHTFFGSLIRTGIDEGSIREVDTDHAARVLVAFAVGLLMQGLLEPEGANWAEVSALGMDMLMNGLMEATHS
jgi:AcrR family transcriptional regulator